MRSLAGAANINLSVASSLPQLIAQLNMPANETAIVVLGLDALIQSQRSAKRAVIKVREKLPNATVILHTERKHLIDAHDQRWAKMCGANDIVAKITATRWSHTGDELMNYLETDETQRARMRHRIMPYVRAAQQLETKDEATRVIAQGEALGFDLIDLARRLGRSGGVDIRDRSYHLRSFPECFVASEAVDWITQALKVTRADAQLLGRAMQDCGLIYHVAREQAFADAYLFFRVARLPETLVIADFVAQVSATTGFERRDRTYLGTEYKHCFIGKEALAWCRAHRMNVNEAMSAGQRLIDLSIVSHVANEHPLKDDGLFYRFHDA
jgi:Domain found in Dishevelled, Egl-10, and Pleckstrin (DEP)